MRVSDGLVCAAVTLSLVSESLIWINNRFSEQTDRVAGSS